MELNPREMMNIDSMEIASITEPSGWLELDVLDNCSQDCDCDCTKEK